LDTRAFRLTFPQGTKLFELDLPEVIDKKVTILKDASANCQHYMINADLNQPWEHLLLEKGYQVTIPSVFLVEGLLLYLEEAQVHSLMQRISKLTAPGSHLGLDLLDIGALKTPQGLVQEYLRSGFENVPNLLALYDWDAKVFRAGENTFDYFHIYSQAFSTEEHQSYLVKAKKSNS
jgi:methyltransferase (TIGR00027 family)